MSKKSNKSKRKNRKNKKRPVSMTGRNWLAVSAQFASGAGTHADARLKRNRTRSSQKRDALAEYI